MEHLEKSIAQSLFMLKHNIKFILEGNTKITKKNAKVISNAIDDYIDEVMDDIQINIHLYKEGKYRELFECMKCLELNESDELNE